MDTSRLKTLLAIASVLVACSGDDSVKPQPTRESGACQQDPMDAASAGACVSVGTPGFDCNPVSQQGCDTATGETCDLSKDGYFKCFAPPNDAPACGTCSNESGPYCVPGFTCNGGLHVCTHYCCDASDCADGATCVLQHGTTLGICQATSADALAIFGTGAQPVACSAPGSAPSGGKCVPDSAGDCNPVTNEPCELVGGACDLGTDGRFVCFQGNVSSGLCAACGSAAPDGATCQGTLACYGGQCARYCCDDGDCGDGQCVTSLAGVGVCLERADAGVGGAAGSLDAGNG